MDEDPVALIGVFKICTRGLVFIGYGAKKKMGSSHCVKKKKVGEDAR